MCLDAAVEPFRGPPGLERGLNGSPARKYTSLLSLGIAGIFDVASYYGLEKRDKEDYGQTLGTWGVGEGCYLVLPILGPSTARDTVGSLASLLGGDPWYNVTVKNESQYFKDSDYYISRVTTGVDFRAKNIGSFDNL